MWTKPRLAVVARSPLSSCRCLNACREGAPPGQAGPGPRLVKAPGVLVPTCLSFLSALVWLTVPVSLDGPLPVSFVFSLESVLMSCGLF